jgi:hypothetical protein
MNYKPLITIALQFFTLHSSSVFYTSNPLLLCPEIFLCMFFVSVSPDFIFAFNF